MKSLIISKWHAELCLSSISPLNCHLRQRGHCRVSLLLVYYRGSAYSEGKDSFVVPIGSQVQLIEPLIIYFALALAWVAALLQCLL
jgi:hypothetical protein